MWDRRRSYRGSFSRRGSGFFYSFCSHKGTFLNHFECLRVSVLWRHKGAAAGHSVGSIQPKEGRWFLPWESSLETFLCPEGCGYLNPKVDSLPVCFKIGKQSRSLKFRLLSQNIFRLQITYLIPAAHPAAIECQLELCCPCPGRKPSRFSWEGAGSPQD